MTFPVSSAARRVALAAALVVTAPSGLRADRRDQKAADLYADAVSAIERGRPGEAVPLLLAALGRGASEPNEVQGGESRFLVYRYDPYYWLGVAFMETGEDDRALLCLEKSEVYGVLKRWPDAHADLLARRAALERRYPAPAGDPPPAPPCLAPEAVRARRTCLAVLVDAFGPGSSATPGQEAYVEGELAYLAGDAARAVDRLRRAVAEDPVEALERFRYRGLNREDYLPRFYLGLALAALGRTDAARAELVESRRQVTALHRPAVRRVLERTLAGLGTAR